MQPEKQQPDYPPRRHQPDRAEAEVLSLTLRLAVLEDLSRLLGHQTSPDEVCRYITNLVPTVVDADAASLLLFDPHTDAFTTAAVAGDRAHAVPSVSSQTAPAFSIAHWVASHKQPLAIVSPANDYRFSPEIDALLNWPLRSLASVPMLAQDKILGVIHVFNRRESPLFSDAELDLLSAFANQAALIIQNARLIATLDQKNRQLTSLIEVSGKVTSSLDLRTVLVEILNAAVSVLGGNAASILLLDKESGQLFFEATLGDRGLLLERHSLPPGRGIAGWVIKERKPVYVSDVRSDPRFDPTISSLAGLEVRSLLAAPLNVRDETIGVIEILNPPNAEEGAKLDLISSFANHAALAVNNARLLQEAQSQSPAPPTHLADALAAEREWSASIDQATSDGILLVDKRGNLLRANPAARTLLQFPQGPLPNLATLIPDPSFASAFAAQPQGPPSVEFQFGKVPPRRHLQARFFQLPDDQTLIAFSDITPQERLQEMGRDLRFFASHALLAPLSAIKESTDALLAGAKTPEDSASLLRLISQECEALLRLLDSMGRLTEVEAGLKLSLQPVLLPPIVEKALASDSLDLVHRQIHSQIPPDLPPVAADPEKLLQILLSLLSNATKYSLPASPITIKARRHSSRSIALSVSDKGVGIPKSQLPSIFDKYYGGPTPGSPSKGIGLGLYLVKQLVQAHGGKIGVKSDPGKGSTFTIILPLSQDKK